MESNKRLYIVSFGDSRQYRLPFVDKVAPDGLHHSDLTPLTQVERELNTYLRERFPDDHFAYFTTPRVTEVEWSHRDKYEAFPLLDAHAMEDIKRVLSKEVRDMRSTEKLNSNSPFSDINAAV